MSILTKKAIGQRGSWFADVDGETLPCVHEHWYQRPPRYHDPEFISGNTLDDRYDKFVDSIRSYARVIMQKDKKSHKNTAGQTVLELDGYIAVFCVDSITYDRTGLRFRVTNRLCNLS